MLRFGIYYAYWQDDYVADFKYYIEKCFKLGFDVLELDAIVVTEMMSAKERIDLKKCADNYGIYLTLSAGFPPELDMASKDEQIQKNAVNSALRIIRTISQIGVEELPGIIHSAWNPVIEDNLMLDKKSYTERSLKNMSMIIKSLEDHGIIYHIEVLNRFEHYMLNTLNEAINYIKLLDSPNIKILADIFHLNIEEDDMINSIKEAKDYIGYVHLGECNRNLPGRGRMNWDSVAKVLSDINYDGCIVIEPFVKTGGPVAKDVKLWRNILEDVSEEALDRYAFESIEFLRHKFQKYGTVTKSV